MKSMDNIQEQFFDSNLRVESVVSLSWVADFSALPPAIEEMLREFEVVADHVDIALSIPDDAQQSLDDEDWAVVATWLFDSGYKGVFIEVGHPFLEKTADAPSFTWNFYETRWFYGNDIDQAIKAAIQWGQEDKHLVRGTAN